MLVVWKYTKSSTLAKLKLKPKKRNFPRSEIAKGQEVVAVEKCMVNNHNLSGHASWKVLAIEFTSQEIL